MAVTEWVTVGTGIAPGAATPIPGVVVNGGGAQLTQTPTSGRGYPRT